MGHRDEEILKIQKQMAKEQEKSFSAEDVEVEGEESIFDGTIHIYEKPIKFGERLIPELNLKIRMPELFELLDDEIKKVIYPMGNAPSHVFGSGEIEFNLALSCTQNKIPNHGIPKFLPMAKKVVDAIGPKSRIIGSGVIQKEDWNFAMLEFVSRAIDTNVYNVMFCFSVMEHLMIGTINFPVKHQKHFTKMAKEMIDSLEMINPEEV